MAETQLGTLIDHLVTTLETLRDGSLASYQVQVIDGPGALDIRNNVILVGSTFTPVSSADVRQNWQYVGRVPPSRHEDLVLRCALRYAVGNRDVASARNGALAMYAAISGGLRANVDAFTAGGIFQQIQIQSYRLYQDLTDNGISAIIEFDVAAVARV